MAAHHEPTATFDRALILAGVLLLIGACLPADKVAAEPAVDLELVLAVDTSGSMSRADLRIQRQGYIAALRHDDVAEAIAFRGGVALAYMEWAGPDEQRIVVPWTIVSDATGAERFAERLAGSPLEPGFGSPPWKTGTSISRALMFAADMFSFNGASHTIDISGNGPNNSGGALAPAREFVIARGIAINGLPIVRPGAAEPAFPLAAYYEDCVIGGPGAFALPVDDPEEFVSTLRRKMVLEIAGMPQRFTLAGFEPMPELRIDCTSSETGH